MALLIKRLADRGVTPSVATELVRDYPPELIEMQVEVLDRLQRAKERVSIRNPAGYLVKSIRDGYLPPAKMMERQTKVQPKAQPMRAIAEARSPEYEAIDVYLNSLSKEEFDALEIESLECGDKVLIEGYHRSQQAGGPTFAVYRRMLLERGAKLRLFVSKDPHASAA